MASKWGQPKRPGRWEKAVLPLITLGVFLALWQGVVAAGIYTPYQLPGPRDVFLGIGELARTGTLKKHVVISLYRFGLGYSLAVAAGIPLGLLLGWYSRLFLAFDPFIQVLRPISPIAWFPLAILWFKVGNPPAIFIIFMSAFFPTLLSTIAAVRQVEPVYFKVAANFGTRPRDTFVKVIFPAAFPNIMVGLHIALGTAWIHLVAGEMLGAQSGLGYMIVDARNFLRTDLIIGGMLLVGAIGLVFDKLIGWLEKRIRRNWGYLPG